MCLEISYTFGLIKSVWDGLRFGFACGLVSVLLILSDTISVVFTTAASTVLIASCFLRKRCNASR